MKSGKIYFWAVIFISFPIKKIAVDPQQSCFNIFRITYFALCKFGMTKVPLSTWRHNIVGIFPITDNRKNPMTYSTETLVNELTPVFQLIIHCAQSRNLCLQIRMLQITNFFPESWPHQGFLSRNLLGLALKIFLPQSRWHHPICDHQMVWLYWPG